MAELFWFSDEQWAQIERLLPTNTRGLKRVDVPPCVERHHACFVFGVSLVALPAGVWAVQDHLQSLCALGAPRHLGGDLRDAGRSSGCWGSVSDQFNDRQSAPQRGRRKRGAQHHAIGRSVAGRTTKIHLVTDAAGRPRVIRFAPGNTNDHKPARRCLELMPPARYVIADKGYDSAPLRLWLLQRGSEAVIPPRRNRKVLYRYDETLYRRRNVIERTVNRFKDWRRIATRYDRNAVVYLHPRSSSWQPSLGGSDKVLALTTF